MIREYQKEDLSEIEELCKEIWEGNDYLPGLINSFVDDPTCYPQVLVKDNKIVSVVNLRLYSQSIGWSEAMRTHPNYRGKGYATKLQMGQLELAKKLGLSEIWLSTADDNEATRLMLERMNLTEHSKFYLKRIKEIPKNYNEKDIRKCSIKEAKSIISKLSYPFLIGVFRVIPVDSDYAKSLEDNLYCINNRSVFLIGRENESDLIVGFNGYPEDIDTAIAFGATFEHEDLKLFVPPNVGYNDQKAFRFMIYKLENLPFKNE